MRHASDSGGLLHAPGRPYVLSQGARTSRGSVCRPGRVGPKDHSKRGERRKILERPNDCRVRGGYLDAGTMPSTIEQFIETSPLVSLRSFNGSARGSDEVRA